MVERRAAPLRAQHPRSALATVAGEPVTVVHLAAEYVPFARTGGLAEAAANLARFQSRAGIRSLALLPLYRSVRDSAGELVPVGDPFIVQLGPRRETVRLLRQR